ncbi:MAG: GHKL domain-containing protein [Clostridiales bacterium]|nr:GHKL domain-containing protein [Clostridiales bacterium]
MAGGDFSHTPGFNYALAYWLSCLVYSFLLPHRSLSKPTGVGISLTALLGVSSFMVLTDGIDRIYFIPCMLLDVTMMLIYLHSMCEVDWKKAAYFCVRAFILGEAAAAVEWQVFYFLQRNGWIPGTLPYGMAVMAVTYLAVFAVPYLLESRHTEGNAQMAVSWQQLGTMALLAVSVYTISNLSFVYQNTPFSSVFTQEIFIIRSLTDVGGVGIMFSFHMQNLNMSFRVKADYLQKLLAMQYDNYRIHEESVRLVNQKYHDLKHQIALLRSEITSGEKLQYLDELEQDIRSYEARNKTGNNVLDTILTARSLQCQREGIVLTCTADGSALDFMNAMDISILFGNALDNAIESVSGIPEQEKRLIHLTVSRQKSFVRIHMENCYRGELKMVDGMPVTSKQDTDFHGFGLKSIGTIVDKYGGSMTVRAENGWFELRVLFNRPE